MNELTVSILDEDFSLVNQLAKRYRATPKEIVQAIVFMELANLEPDAETDERFLDALNPDESNA